MVAERDNNGQLILSNPAPSVTFADKQGSNVTGCSVTYRPEIAATVATVPISLAPEALVITHSVGAMINGINGTNAMNGVDGAP